MSKRPLLLAPSLIKLYKVIARLSASASSPKLYEKSTNSALKLRHISIKSVKLEIANNSFSQSSSRAVNIS